MKRIDRRTFLKATPAVTAVGGIRLQPAAAAPFGDDYRFLDTHATGDWWLGPRVVPWPQRAGKPVKPVPPIVDLQVPRDRVVAFALYTHDAGVLKVTAQL